MIERSNRPGHRSPSEFYETDIGIGYIPAPRLARGSAATTCDRRPNAAARGCTTGHRASQDTADGPLARRPDMAPGDKQAARAAGPGRGPGTPEVASETRLLLQVAPVSARSGGGGVRTHGTAMRYT